MECKIPHKDEFFFETKIFVQNSVELTSLVNSYFVHIENVIQQLVSMVFFLKLNYIILNYK